MNMLGGFKSAFWGAAASCMFGATVLGTMFAVRSWGAETLAYGVVALGLIVGAIAFGVWSYLASQVLEERR